jgi:NAD(P)-dependent dehydrogenase (short-subunit alcohol dehydrogenase family)
MEVKDKIIVVTGGANGIGRALCRRFATEGARGIVVADLDADGADEVASEFDGLAVGCNVAIESEMTDLVARTLEDYGQIDLFCSNAGIATGGGVDVSNDEWSLVWNINFMSHIYAARAVIPHMLERGSGYLLQTASAAGLLTQIGSAPYSVTKHAAISLAEWLSITYGDKGIGVSCLCPMGVRTDMLAQENNINHFLREGSVSPEEVADAVIAGLREERFLILPHADVARYFQNKANDYDRWIRGMRGLQRKVIDDGSK